MFSRLLLISRYYLEEFSSRPSTFWDDLSAASFVHFVSDHPRHLFSFLFHSLRILLYIPNSLPVPTSYTFHRNQPISGDTRFFHFLPYFTQRRRAFFIRTRRKLKLKHLLPFIHHFFHCVQRFATAILSC